MGSTRRMRSMRLARGGKLMGTFGVGRVLPSRATSRTKYAAPDKSHQEMHRKGKLCDEPFISYSKTRICIRSLRSGGASGVAVWYDEESGDEVHLGDILNTMFPIYHVEYIKFPPRHVAGDLKESHRATYFLLKNAIGALDYPVSSVRHIGEALIRRGISNSKWATLNGNCQKFDTIFKRLDRNGKRGESEVDLFKRAKIRFREE
ncbi:hypothetical protein Tco_0728726 [Tanacetum coccineum]|uniref:Uncharacterized protein n=1 Tax=Tanacetum coccineum TaxID=301880 RepID=A0ABQ4YMU1_9ASTR